MRCLTLDSHYLQFEKLLEATKFFRNRAFPSERSRYAAGIEGVAEDFCSAVATKQTTADVVLQYPVMSSPQQRGWLSTVFSLSKDMRSLSVLRNVLPLPDQSVSRTQHWCSSAYKLEHAFWNYSVNRWYFRGQYHIPHNLE